MVRTPPFDPTARLDPGPEDHDEPDDEPEAPETPLDEPPPVPLQDPPPQPDQQGPYVVSAWRPGNHPMEEYGDY